jgi:hypothetical protein
VAIKQVLLVAGFDYEFGGVSFAELCRNRMGRLINKFPKDKLIFVLFDVATGRISKNEIKDPKKKDSMKNRQWTTVQSFTAVGPANDSGMVPSRENHFNANPAGIMSITDIYAFVEAIGAGPDAGSVQELSFFCHGWMGGPILVNSSDPTRDDPTQPRDPERRASCQGLHSPENERSRARQFRQGVQRAGLHMGLGLRLCQGVQSRSRGDIQDPGLQEDSPWQAQNHRCI